MGFSPKVTLQMRRIYFLFFFLTVLSCSPRKASYKFSEELDSYFQKQFPSDEPGGAVIVTKGGKVIFSKGYGLADLKTKEQITPKTLFNLGSISKTFVANAILILQEQGKLSVEDNLLKYFPDFKNKDIAQRVKIKHLLSHTSGLPDNREIKKDSVFYLSAKDGENWYPVTQTEVLNFEPGEGFEYSNPAYNGLALIVEKVSGEKWQEFVTENILRLSGMKNSTITDGPYPESGVAHAYIHVKDQWHEKDYGEEPTFAAAGNGGVWSSTEELLFYEQALQKALWLKPETIAQSREIFSPSNWKSNISPAVGWSWFIGKTAEGLKTVGHTGTQGGFSCNYVTIPEKGIHFLILCNTPRDVDEFTKHIMNEL
jgi:CubicO group peptidase (beta-lactamase class C family)